MKRLILMRHAKTEPWDESVDDHGRALTSVGHIAAEAVAIALKTSGWVPDKALISTARRTRETWGHLAQVFPATGCHFDESLYLASARVISDVIQRHHGASTLMMIGHNPGIHELSLSLIRDAGASDDTIASRLAAKMPTGGTAMFEASEEGNFRPSSFKLVQFIAPKDLIEPA